MTSKGVNCIALGSSSAWLGTTVTASVCKTEHVSTTENTSPTLTAAALVRHQQRIGSAPVV